MPQRPRSALRGPCSPGVTQRTTADDYRALPHRPHGGVHLLVGYLAVLSLVSGDELVKRSKPTVLLRLQAQCLIHPGADALRLTGGDGRLTRLDQVRVDGHGQTALGSHTNSVHVSHSYGINSGGEQRNAGY